MISLFSLSSKTLCLLNLRVEPGIKPYQVFLMAIYPFCSDLVLITSHPLNLRRWKFCINAKCGPCHSPLPTIHHILSGCPTALDQGRFTWRHDSVLSILVQSVKQYLQGDQKVYADLPGWLASESPPATLPSDLSAFTVRPDIVVTSLSEILYLS